MNKDLEYTEVFAKLVDNLKSKRALDISSVINAFNFAEKCHTGQKRKTGEPYISHPVAVAFILSEMNFDTNVISAGLLHDVVEDCGVSVQFISENFNTEIAQIVDAVTKIEMDLDQKEENEFLEAEEEIKTYQKLIEKGKVNILAFYIKFADRLHNLSTISTFKKYKKQQKVKETEKWLMPFLKLLKAQEFYVKISNRCFKILHEDELCNFQSIYEKYFKNNRKAYFKMRENLNININKLSSKNNLNLEINKIIIENFTEEEVYEKLKKELDIKKFDDIKQSFFIKFPLNKICLVFNNSLQSKDIHDIIFELLSNNSEIQLIGYGIEEFSQKSYFIIEDKSRIKYQVYGFTTKGYSEFKNGTTKGLEVSYLDSNQSTFIASSYIKTYTKDGDEIYLPENATVLDFAFKIHKDFGFACKFAYLNGAPVKSPIYTKLSNGDKVLLAIQKNAETGYVENIAKLRWLMYVKTENAQKCLIRYFESKIEERLK